MRRKHFSVEDWISQLWLTCPIPDFCLGLLGNSGFWQLQFCNVFFFSYFSVNHILSSHMKVNKIRFKNLITTFQTEPTDRDKLSTQGTIFSPFLDFAHLCATIHMQKEEWTGINSSFFEKKLVRKFQRSNILLSNSVDKQENVGNLFETTWNAVWEALALLSRVIWNSHLVCIEHDWHKYARISWKATASKQQDHFTK